MANIRYITRTIEENTYSALVFNTATNATEIQHFAVGKVKSDSEALSIIQRKFNTETLKAVYIVSKDAPVLRKYRMPEELFVKYGELVTDFDEEDEDEE